MNATPTNSPTPNVTKDGRDAAYENNPFFVATNGLDLLFKKAQSVGIALAILAGLSLLSSLPSYFAPAPVSTPETSTVETPANTTSEVVSDPSFDTFMNDLAQVPVEVWLIAGVIVLAIVLVFLAIGLVISGVIDYTAARMARDESVTLSEALRAVFSNFWGYLWVQVVMDVKILLWSLLFIIPGLIMAVRYSLSGVVYFDKQLKGNGSVKASAALTKGGWLTTFASHSLMNIITLGFIPMLLAPGTSAVLYRQFDKVGPNKPKAHALSWVTLLLPVVLLVLLLILVMSVISLILNSTPSPSN